MPPIRSWRLLEQADELAGRTAGRGRPRDVDLRRAVSAAYYGLFHLVTNYASIQLAEGQANEDRMRLRRSFSHAGVRRVGGWVGGIQRPPGQPEAIVSLVDVARTSANLVLVGPALVDLQEARHAADYDHLWVVSRSDVLGLVDQARAAQDAIESEPWSPAFEAFSILLLMKAGSS